MARVVNFEYTPLSVHAPFHMSTTYERCLFGAFGSGKTYAICAEAIAWALEQPGSRILITRRTVPELRDTTETVFFDLLPDELFKAGKQARAGGHTERFTFPNGSEVLFRSIDDWNKHKSLNVCAIAWDELDEFDEETYMGMASRVRQRDPTPMARRLGVKHVARRGMWAATNPHGHDWTWARFVKYGGKENTEYFRSTSFDNPFLPPEYYDALLSYPEPWIKRYVLCQFDDFAGQIYESWNWDQHVINPLEPGRDYPVGAVFWMGFDPGTRSANAGLWVYVDKANRRLVGVAEYEQEGLAASKHAAEWRKLEAKHRMHVRQRIADPNSITMRDRGSNMKLIDQYARLGFHFSLGPSKPADRIPMLGQMIETGRFVVTKACPRTYEAIKNYRWEDLTPAKRAKGEEAPEKPVKDQYTHLTEAAQYVCSRHVAPPPLLKVPRHDSFHEEVHSTIRRQIKAARTSRQAHDLGSIRV